MRISHSAAGTILLLAGLGTLSSAGAAPVAMIGGGTADVCYQQTQSAADIRTGIVTCTDALRYQRMSPEDHASTYMNRGILRSLANDNLGALADFTAAVDLAPDNAEVYLNRSAALISLKRFADARRDADQAIQRGAPRLEVAYYNRAVANEGLGDIRGAYQDFKMALQVKPTFTAAQTQLTRFQVKTSGT